MELPQRKGEDRFLPAGRYGQLQEKLRGNPRLGDIRSLVVSAFDRRTRMFPFIGIDWYSLPCGPRSIAGAMVDAGMPKTRFVYQLWNPNVQPSRAELDGQPIDMLMTSSMQVHSAASYKLIEDAWTLGDRRPLIIAGGPKACYEPFDYFGLGRDGQIGADVVVTGEEPVLLELLAVLSDFGAGHGRMREAFDRAKASGALLEIPGLVYSADERYDGKNLINTGIQRLIRDLDELPMPISGFRTLEYPHRRHTLARETFPLHKAGAGMMVTTLLITRGCKNNCQYCSIPSYNQRSYRRKSPERVVAEFVECHAQLNTRYVFGADDNFFNNRAYAEAVLEGMARTRIRGERLGRSVNFGTESTVDDAYRCRDLFPVARKSMAGLSALWLGVEDLSATLVDKGQGPEKTQALFEAMLANDISPMVMMMHHDAQPLRSKNDIKGLLNQIKFLHKAGAVSLQCTLANPAFGSRWVNQAITQGQVFSRVGGQKIEDRHYDGNHIVASSRQDSWRMQRNYLLAYLTFYNPINFFKSFAVRRRTLLNKHLFYQVWGMGSLLRTAWSVKGHLWRLWRGPIERLKGWPERYCRPGTPYIQLIPENKTPDQQPAMASLPGERATRSPVAATR